jgi:penicillin-binding protein 2A
MKNKKRKKKNPLLKWVLVLLSLLVIVIMAGCTAAMTLGSTLVDEGKVKEQIETSTIFDQQGQEVAKLYAVEDREYVEYQKIPELVKKAFVNTEDERFYSHPGIDVIAIGRAIYKDILAGSAVEGASTITQQLAKNVYLTNQKTLWRKTQEALIALNLEQNYSKEQILEFYLNEIYFGDAVYGIQAASEYYFGKDVQDLNLSETATLAGLPKAPNNYSPFKNYEKAIERRNTVLYLMHRNGSITAEQKDAAMKEELKLVKKGKSKEGLQSYIDYLLKEASEKYGLTENQLYRGGYKIHTQMDALAQQSMAKAFSNPKLFPASKSKDIVQAGMVMLDPHTGGIVAMMGGRDYVSKDLNRALRKRSPGSAFKPLAVYAPALEKGWNPYDMLRDEKLTFAGNYSPKNYNNQYDGEVTLYDSLKDSKNVPAVWLLNEIGIDTSFRYLDRFGIPYDKKEDRQLGIALGGLTNGVSTLDMARAYSAFANQGVIIEPHIISSIHDRDGNVIVEAEVNTSTVVSEQTAYYMTKMLQTVVSDGTGKAASMNRPVAGKTGTTQMEGTGGKGNRDAWFVGYTPEYVGAIYMGYDQSDSKTNYLTKGSSVTAAIFKTVMEETLQGRKVTSFTKPKGIPELQPPIRLDQITDLHVEQIAGSIHLQWTGGSDERVVYHIYRFKGDPNQKEWIGDTEYNEWIDLTVVPEDEQPISYYIVPFDPLIGREGKASNVVEIVPYVLDEELLPPAIDDEENSNIEDGEPLPESDIEIPLVPSTEQPNEVPATPDHTDSTERQP